MHGGGGGGGLELGVGNPRVPPPLYETGVSIVESFNQSSKILCGLIGTA